jgi:hypothetical protein
VSGTSDNSVLSLIFGYNGLGRVEGQTGGPAGGGSGLFGSTPGPLRLLNNALGGQAGWLLGFAVVSALGLLVASRLRRSDARTGWLIAVGGAFLVTAVLFSAAGGIFHPYYVSLLAPFIAALVGAGAARLTGGGLQARIVGPLAILAGVAVELAVRGQYPGQLTWLVPVLVVVGAFSALALAASRSRRVRVAAASAAVGALLLAPSVWALDTLGHATSGTFPAGGPASVASEGGGGFGGFGGRGGGQGPRAGAKEPQLFGPAGPAGGTGAGPGFAQRAGPPPGITGGAGGRFGGAGGAPGAGGAFGGGESSVTTAVSYVKQHGGGTIAVSSQSSAASAIIKSDVEVAGIGGFSGRESEVSTSWLAQEVGAGRIRWVLVNQGRTGGALPGDTRTGSKTAMAAVAKACVRVTLPANSTSTGTGAGASTLYDCQGRAAALTSAGGVGSA